MILEFDSKEEFETGIYESVKERGETNVCNIIKFSISEKGKKKLKKLYGDKKIGNIIFDLVENSGKYEITDKSAKDKNIWKFKITETQDKNELGKESKRKSIEDKQVLVVSECNEEKQIKKKDEAAKHKAENPFELPADDTPDAPRKRKVIKALKDEINEKMVQVNENYCISKFSVTQEIYEKVMGVNPSKFKDNPDGEEKQKERPVEMISYNDAIMFCNKLSESCGYEKCYDENTWMLIPEVNGFRLPSEKEWNFAANGGKDISETKYSGAKNPYAVWYDNSSNSKTHQVGLKASVRINGNEVYDMSGNVWEMCEFDSNINRVPCFGGAYNVPESKLELGTDSNRMEITREYKNSAFGFRICVNSLKN